jgi:hypothetical protein
MLSPVTQRPRENKFPMPPAHLIPAPGSCYAAAHIPPLQKSPLNKTPNFKQQKKRREDQQKKRNEEKQRQQAARKATTFQPEKS